jgi:hypothetical protein
MNETYAYLASPYSHENPEIMEERYRLAVLAAADLMMSGWVIFSPIVHSHSIGQQLGKQAGGNLNPVTHNFWMNQDLPLLAAADVLLVLCLPGWRESKGVKEEIEYAKRAGKKIQYVDFDITRLCWHSDAAEADMHSREYEAALSTWFGPKIPTPKIGAHLGPQKAMPEAVLERSLLTGVWPPLDVGKQNAPVSAGTKDTNPKDAIGSTKVPLSLVPPIAIAHAALAHLDGASKYGRWNWRIAGVRASIYVDAALRHLEDWFHGEEIAPDGVHHLGHALACINIILDAAEHGKLNDDRPPGDVSMSQSFERLAGMVTEISNRYARRDTPRHYSIADNAKKVA